ncbi:hypothetical protein ACFFVB_18500 [Formosa undariae]|uniref:Uncharacterized protein n=1 Tax=Formosa undariae TaxID=1325436 RepID=A0ABV5F6L0_9FLAO
MKTLRKLILKFWLRFFPKQIISEINGKIEDAIIIKNSDRIALVKKVRLFLLEEYNIGGRSKYIPTKFKHREKIVAEVHNQYGEALRAHGLTFNSKLKFVKL